LVNEETIAAGELFGGSADCICEVDELLVDEELLKDEVHGLLLRGKANRMLLNKTKQPRK
jgi:hypothetical protein